MSGAQLHDAVRRQPPRTGRTHAQHRRSLGQLTRLTRPLADVLGAPADLRRDRWRHSGLWAVGVWLVCLPVAFALPDVLDLSPFGAPSAVIVLAIGALLLAAVAWLARRWHSPAVPGIATGAAGGWALLAMRAGLYGTPYPFMAGGDTVRLSAMAERYTTTLHSADGIVASVPADYPPLFPWVVGRLSVLSGIPAWRLVGPVEMVLASAVLVAGFLLWRRVVSDWLAFALALATFGDFLTPAKAYEWMALELIIPWALATFVTTHERRPLGWRAAGIIGGVQVVLYQAYLMFFAVGLVALILESWRRSPQRGAYAWYVVRVTIVGCVVAAGYLVPYFHWALTHGLQMTDRYKDPMIRATPLELFSVGPLGLLTLIGIVGLVRYRRRAWWAVPLLWLILSAYVYRVVGQIEYRHTGQTLVFPYTIHVVTAALIVAGVLTFAAEAPGLWSRRSSRHVSVNGLGLALLLVYIGLMGWSEWIPGAATLQGFQFLPPPDTGSAPVSSFVQPLPDGRYPRFAPSTGRLAWFPTDLITADVEHLLGAHAAPLTLSYSEQLFATQPWPGYLGVGANAAASTSHWFSRLAELQHLARITNPTRFADASAHTPYGAINAFILQAHSPTAWDWIPTNYPAIVRFTPTQFSSPAFTIIHNLPDNTELIIRRPTTR